MTTGYCVKCRSKREIKGATAVTMKNGKPAVKFEWKTIEEISIPVAQEPVKDTSKYNISEDIFNVGIGQQVPTP